MPDTRLEISDAEAADILEEANLRSPAAALFSRLMREGRIDDAAVVLADVDLDDDDEPFENQPFEIERLSPERRRSFEQALAACRRAERLFRPAPVDWVEITPAQVRPCDAFVSVPDLLRGATPPDEHLVRLGAEVAHVRFSDEPRFGDAPVAYLGSRFVPAGQFDQIWLMVPRKAPGA